MEACLKCQSLCVHPSQRMALNDQRQDFAHGHTEIPSTSRDLAFAHLLRVQFQVPSACRKDLND